MPIWKLTPADLGDPAWEASRRRGPAIVRAASEGAARRVAASTFRLAADADAVGAEPWTDPVLVKAEQVQDPRYEPHGKSEVLDAAT